MYNENYFEYTFGVNSCHIDLKGEIKPSLILSYCQECAYMHSAEMGFGYNRLKEIGVAWVLSRINVECQRMPVWGETIKVRTWHKRQSRLFSIRDYIFYDEQQNEIIKVTSSWVIINTSTRRISRIEHLFGEEALGLTINSGDSAIDDEAKKVVISEEQILLSEHIVRYSDIDVNQHVNNARYLEWVCDLSPLQLHSNSSLNSIVINFNHEATLGEVVSLSSPASSEGLFVMEGRVGERSVFVSELKYHDAR